MLLQAGNDIGAQVVLPVFLCQVWTRKPKFPF